VEVQLHILTSALDGGEWSALHGGCFISVFCIKSNILHFYAEFV